MFTLHLHVLIHCLTCSLSSILLAIRDVCVDWLDGKERNDDPALRGEKDPKMGFHIDLPRRPVGLSSTQVLHQTAVSLSLLPFPPLSLSQLYMMRTMLESLISEKVSGKKSLRSELHQPSLPEFEQFHRTSFFFISLLNFSSEFQTISNCIHTWCYYF